MYKQRLKDLRENYGLQIHDISKILGFEKDTYGKYEREYVIIPIKHLNSLCNYFNISIDYIFGFTDKSHYQYSLDDINTTLTAERLKNFRKENRLTQEKLADILKVVKGTIGNYESNRSIIATPFLYTICNMYGISADYLLGKTNEPKYWK